MTRDQAAIILLAIELARAECSPVNVRAAREAHAHLVRLASLVTPADVAQLEAVLAAVEKEPATP